MLCRSDLLLVFHVVVVVGVCLVILVDLIIWFAMPLWCGMDRLMVWLLYNTSCMLLLLLLYYMCLVVHHLLVLLWITSCWLRILCCANHVSRWPYPHSLSDAPCRDGRQCWVSYSLAGVAPLDLLFTIATGLLVCACFASGLNVVDLVYGHIMTPPSGDFVAQLRFGTIIVDQVCLSTALTTIACLARKAS